MHKKIMNHKQKKNAPGGAPLAPEAQSGNKASAAVKNGGHGAPAHGVKGGAKGGKKNAPTTHAPLQNGRKADRPHP